MASAYCRLCLGKDNLIDLFDPNLANADQLRACVLMCTGVHITVDDIVSKCICSTCSEISLKLFKFRKNALVNDNSLKKTCNQTEPQHHNNIHNIAVNEFLVKNTRIRISFGNQLLKKQPTAKRTMRNAVHVSVFKLMKTYPHIKLPSDVIKQNCDPKVYATKLDVETVNKLRRELRKHADTDNDLNIFKKKFPNISIVQINDDVNATTSRTPLLELPKEQNCKVVPPLILAKSAIIYNPDSNDVQSDNTYQPKKRCLDIGLENSKKKLKISTLAGLESHQSICENVKISEEVARDIVGVSSADTDRINFNEVVNSEHDQSKKMLRPRTSRPSFYAENDLDDYICEDYEDDFLFDGESNLLHQSLVETIGVETSFPCEVCNRTFSSRKKLKSHKRVHKTCIVCRQKFQSQKLLKCHLIESCYKTIINNPPTLCLKRCDEGQIKEFEVSKNFDFMCISDDDSPSTTEQIFESWKMTDSKEKEKIASFINKYYTSCPSFLKSSWCQEDAGLYECAMNKSQFTLTNMYSILTYFRIPVVVSTSDTMKVSVIDTPLATNSKQNTICSWSNLHIKNPANKNIAEVPGLRKILPKSYIARPLNFMVSTKKRSTSKKHRKQIVNESCNPSGSLLKPSINALSIDTSKNINFHPQTSLHINPLHGSGGSTFINIQPIPSVCDKRKPKVVQNQTLQQPLPMDSVQTKPHLTVQPATTNLTLQRLAPSQVYVETSAGYVASTTASSFNLTTCSSVFAFSSTDNNLTSLPSSAITLTKPIILNGTSLTNSCSLQSPRLSTKLAAPPQKLRIYSTSKPKSAQYGVNVQDKNTNIGTIGANLIPKNTESNILANNGNMAGNDKNIADNVKPPSQSRIRVKAPWELT